MTKVTLEIHDDVLKTLFKIQNINDTGIDLEIPEGSVLFDNIMNLKLIEKEVDKKGVTVHFITKSQIGNSLLMMMNEAAEPQAANMSEIGEEHEQYDENFQDKIKLRLPAMPKIKLTGPRTAKPVVFGLLVAGVLFAAALYLTRTQEAIATIKVASQPLARSVTIKVSSTDTTDVSKNMLKGTIVSTSVEGTREIDATGQKAVGSKAKGELKILNNTDDEKKFKKGTQFIYEDEDDKEFVYVSTEDVTVPARTDVTTDPLATETTYKKGEEVVSVEAADIGNKYNIEKKETLTVKGQKSSSFSAAVSEDIEGGKSETVKVVTLEDQTKLKNELLQEITNNIDAEMAKKIGKSQVLIKGSYKTTVTKEEYNHKVDDESEKVSLSMILQAEELTYLKSDLDKLMEDMVENLIPEGFVASDEDKEIKTEVLGNSTNSVLSSEKADLQVTLKTYIVPDIVEADLKKELKGKTMAQAEKVLGGLSNIKGYALDIKPGVPLFKKIPNNENQIQIVIERE